MNSFNYRTRTVLMLYLLLAGFSASAQNNTVTELPSVSFVGRSVQLGKDAKIVLESVAGVIKQHPELRVVVKGYCASTKSLGQLGWDRVNRVITYLVEKEGIQEERFIFVYAGEDGDCNTVDLRAALPGEEGPSSVPPPHPNLRRKN
jgi:hypothetical protein